MRRLERDDLIRSQWDGQSIADAEQRRRASITRSRRRQKYA